VGASWSHLGDNEPSECSVFGDHVWQTNREEIWKSLNLMDNCFSVWHFVAVIERWWVMWANHFLDLLLDSFCTEKGDNEPHLHRGNDTVDFYGSITQKKTLSKTLAQWCCSE
jgi:hypothetical protein